TPRSGGNAGSCARGVPDFATLDSGYMSPLSIKVEFRAEHGGSDECGYAERKRDNREGHGFDHETLPFVLSGNPRLVEEACQEPAVGYVISITLWPIPRPRPWPLRGGLA